MKDERSIKAVDVAELFVDGLTTQQELNAARDAACNTASAAAWSAASAAAWHVAWHVAWNGTRNAAWNVARNAANAATWDAWAVASATWDAARTVANNQQIKLFKDIVNPYVNPINSTILNWNNNLIPNMAQGFYNTKNFNNMPILADALEEAGCTDLDILSHCRDNDVHVKGCWVVDLILGKE